MTGFYVKCITGLIWVNKLMVNRTIKYNGKQAYSCGFYLGIGLATFAFSSLTRVHFSCFQKIMRTIGTP